MFNGIEHMFGMKSMQAGEMMEFSNGLKGIALDLEDSNVGVVIFGNQKGEHGS